jgi:aryl-alcohol dehydrogenase-like predicted oxidoreductase
MHYRILGRTGLSVSEIACGTYRSFDGGGGAGAEKVARLMQENLGLGVNLFDSAPMYGQSETNIGAAVGGGRLPSGGREWFVATKVLQEDLAGARRQIEDSFRVIGGRIDLLQIHNMAGWRAILPYLAELRAARRIRAVGVTHYDPGAFGAIEEAMRTGIPDVIQIPYNVQERRVEQRLLPLARELNLGVLVMTPIQPIFRRAALLGALAGFDLAPYRPFGVSDAGSLCLKYLLSKDPAVVLLPATSRPERVRGNAAVSGTPPLPPELLRRVEQAAGG